MSEQRSPWLRLYRLLRFIPFYVWELLLSNVRIAHDVLTPHNHFRPGIIAVPLPMLTDRQLIVLTNLVTMTPGTVSIYVTEERDTLYVHCMYLDDPARVRQEILDGYVYRIQEIF